MYKSMYSLKDSFLQIAAFHSFGNGLRSKGGRLMVLWRCGDRVFSMLPMNLQ